jgi:GalNAc-alpha-(1->4)-GalNAc-alpha-(1->3)-diNAcBac-PP-undecaprenol alpha-1,4-N-acetyl-D-galactosaminyltransferase
MVISSLEAGGAQRVMVTMANYWAERGWSIAVVTLANDAILSFFDLDSRIERVPLGVAGNSSHFVGAVWNNVRRLRILRHAIQQSRPDVVISFIDQVNALVLLATLGLSISVVVSERIDPYYYRLNAIWDCLRWLAYARADRIVVQSRGAAAYFLPRFQGRVAVIPSPVTALSESWSLDARIPVRPSIVSVGRLVEQKQFDLLLRAFARLKDVFPEWTLTIVGDGPLRSRLESLIRALKLSDRVLMPGMVKNPGDYLGRASLFVMSSRFEGFPRALCEAMASGLAVISTECSSGLREIIRDGENGVLVPLGDEAALAAAMARLMDDDLARRRMGARAMEVAERFSLASVMAMWEELLDGLRRTPST